MSTAEPACYSTPEESGLRVETLSFDRIPHQSRLFLEYLRDPIALREFYPSAVRFHHELQARAPEVLAAHQTDRAALCDALEDMNAAWGAGEETLKNIEMLREADCVAVVSGQQAGLFTGPLYTIYKALSAVKLAGCLNAAKARKRCPSFGSPLKITIFLKSRKLSSSDATASWPTWKSLPELHQEGTTSWPCSSRRID